MKYNPTARTFDCAPSLSDSEVLAFCRDGHLLLPGVVSEEINRRVCDWLDRKVPATPSYVPEGLTHADLQRRRGTHEPSGILLEEWFLEHVLLNPRLAGVMRSLLGPDETTIRSFLATLLFHEDHIFRPLRTLSAGERARLSIAGLMLERRNLLLLDEPNSNLDRTTQAWLLEALGSYGASLVVVSHDVDFVSDLQPDWVLLMPEERLEAYDERHLERVELV